MRYLIYPFFLSIFSAADLPAQLETASHHPVLLTGRVLLPNGTLPAGNIIARAPSDSSILTGAFFMAGSFQVSGLPPHDVLLQFTSLEFSDFYVYTRWPKGQDTLHLADLTVPTAAYELSEVVVSARPNTYRQLADGTVEVRVANTVLATASSTLEILRRSPDLTLDENGTVSVLGKGTAIFYLDGQRVPPEQLTMIPAAEIETIAIIRNPSAKYEASGAAVIEITTVQGPKDGFRLSGQQHLGQAPFGGFRTYSTISLGAKLGKLSTRANADLTLGHDRFQKFTTRDRTDPAVFFSSDVTTDWRIEPRPYSTFGGGLQYDVSETAYASVTYSGSFRQTGGETLNQNLLADQAEALAYNSRIERSDREQNHSLSANYGLTLDTAGSGLLFAGQHTRLKTDIDNPIDERGETAAGPTERRLQNRVDRNIDILAVQLDYTRVHSPKHRLEVGLRHARVENNGVIDFSIAEAGDRFRSDPTLSSFYRYDEQLSAAYLTYQGALAGGFTLNAGIRSEYTQYELWLTPEGFDRLQDQYVALFPSVSLAKAWSERLRLSMAYTARIQRPAYESLNPNPVYQDPYTTIQGNPLLVPQRTHAVELVLGWAGTTAKAGYTYTRDPFGGSALPGDDSRSYVLKRLNLSEGHAYYLSLSRSVTLPWWTSTTTASLSYSEVFAYEFAFAASTPQPQPYFLSDNRFSLGRLGHFEALVYYVGNERNGTIDRYAYSCLTLTYEKQVLNRAVTVRLQAADIFDAVRASGEYRQGATDITFANQWRSNFVRLSASFDLGRFNLQAIRNREAGRTERQRAE